MKIHITIAALLLGTLPFAKGNSDMRVWTFAESESLRAELTEFNEASGELSLRKEDKTVIKLKRDELSTIDKAWLLQWVEYKEEMEAMVKSSARAVLKFPFRFSKEVIRSRRRRS